MPLPESVPQVLIYVAMLVPGFSYATARIWRGGWNSPDTSAASRILEALFVSAIFIVVYGAFAIGLAGGPRKVESWISTDVSGWEPWAIAGLTLLLLVVVPGGTGWWRAASRVKVAVEKGGKQTTKKVATNRNQPTPRGWDLMAYRGVTSRFVRVLTESGEYYGGWWGEDSYMSTYPHDRDIFIAVQWKMGESGEFLEEMPGTLGVWLPITDACVVEWTAEPDQTGAPAIPDTPQMEDTYDKR